MTALGRHLAVGALALALAVAAGVAWPAAAAGRPVGFVSGDGTPLTAMLYEAERRPAPAVVLVHMYTRSKSEWDGLAGRLQAEGVTALAVDLRGHGSSGGASAPSSAMTADVRAAMAWLAARPEVRVGDVVIIGASLGANLALRAAVEEPLVRGVVLLSPSLDYRGVRIESALLRQLGARPALLIASVQDPYALRTIRDLVDGDPGPREQRLSEAPAHGTHLLAADPIMVPVLVDWLRRTLIF